MNTLVVHTGGVGDFVIACHAIAWLARAGPVTVAGHPERAEIAVAAGIAARAVPVDALDLHTAEGNPSARFREFAASFQRAVVWMRDPDGAVRRAFAAAGCADTRCHPGLPPPDWDAHAADHYLRGAGAPAGWRLPTLALPRRPCPWDVVLHPGSGGARKNWPLDRFLALAARFGAAGLRVGWVAGPAEAGCSLPPGADRVPPCRLAELGGMLAGAGRYIGNDSGVTHLAAASGCPTLGIFGPTDPAVWGPLGRDVTVLRGDPWPSVDAVWAACGGALHSA